MKKLKLCNTLKKRNINLRNLINKLLPIIPFCFTSTKNDIYGRT